MLRLKRAAGVGSAEFLDTYTTTVEAMRKFPLVILNVEETDKGEKRCCFFTGQGCRVYDDRPWACRMYPLGAAERGHAGPGCEPFHFVIEESRCHGHGGPRHGLRAGMAPRARMRKYFRRWAAASKS